MNKNQFDNEYYVMNVDGANNHPLLSWWECEYDPFTESDPIELSDLEFPMEIKFDKPYPKNPEIADILSLDGNYAVSEKVKLLFEKLNIYGIQFFPVVIVSPQKVKIQGHYAFHSWNGIMAVDKNNYAGDEANARGKISDLRKFSLDTKVLESIPLEKRQAFHLAETYDKETLVHQTVRDAIIAEGLTGFSFFRIADWDDNAMFR
ncbi:hypothetical protein FACS1894158_09860 [Betaproteobacteria bacterium]|nr:hypothetical protein FACS1894158_09860 [Betaproteobacteria bacterium]